MRVTLQRGQRALTIDSYRRCDDFAVVHAELQRFADPENMARLRHALGTDNGAGAAGRMTDADILTLVARRIASRELTMCTDLRDPTALRWEQTVREPAKTTTPRQAEQAARASRRTPEEEPKKTWIEIRLIGENDEPIPDEPYRIELPDGTVVDGVLDSNGKARRTGLDPGTCKVTFPDLDQDAWVRVS